MCADTQVTPLVTNYTQHVWATYVEMGLISRWLMVSLEASLYRWQGLDGVGHTDGPGDSRIGLWTGLVRKPFNFTLGVILGNPSGNPKPAGGGVPPGVAGDRIARILPTGDGEYDAEVRAAFGKTFGPRHLWPFRHYVDAEVGYWLRTNGFAQQFTYKLEVGTTPLLPFLDRFTVILRLSGVEAVTDGKNLLVSPTGLTSGASWLAYGFEVQIRLPMGMGAAIGLDSAGHGRVVAAGEQLKVSLIQSW